MATTAQSFQHKHTEHRWPEFVYMAMVLTSIAGLAYIFFKG
jgi:hypothetical protein